MGSNLVTANWNRAYKQGKYEREGAIPLIQDIIKAVDEYGLKSKLGFYPGCGNGRNFGPLLDAGLTLEGIDISPVALQQLKARFPRAAVSVGDFLTHQADEAYWYILSIQLFQHGNRQVIEKLFDKAYALLRPGGLFVLRVNAIHTEIVQKYQVTEKTPEGGFTIQYRTGQKEGQAVHFYSAEEIHALTARHYDVVMPLREVFMHRDNNTYWAQWETILQKKE